MGLKKQCVPDHNDLGTFYVPSKSVKCSSSTTKLLKVI